MAGYTKEFLVNAFLDKFINCNIITVEQMESLEVMANTFYDEVGRDKFRVYASLDADVIKRYKETV
jgi:hypothetical protein